MADLILSVDTALGEVPVNLIALIDDTDFKTREESVTYDQAGLDLVFNFITKDGAFTQTAVTPTDTAGVYDWVNQGNGMYTIEIPASGGGTINNDTEGFGWFTGFATGILPWRGPVIHFAPANIVDSFVDGSDVLDVSVTQLAGVEQSLTDLKDFADAGYDPGTNSVEQVKVNDDMRGTDSVVLAGPTKAEMDTAHALLATEAKQDAGDAVADGIAAKLVGITLLAEWLGAIAGKQAADATAQTEIRASGAGSGTYDPATDSGEAQRDRGDAAWPTATGFSTHDAAAVWAVATRVLTANTNLNDPTAAVIADAVHDEPIEDHDTQGTAGWSVMLGVYAGSDGPGIYIDSGAANTNTVVGTDGTKINPVSTFAAARTLADAVGVMVYYLEGNSDITLAATHEDWEFIGLGSVADNVINLGSQDVDRSLFRNLTIEGTQGGTGRITARDCALQDPGAGDTTLHIFAERCGMVDRIQVDTSADNVFDGCFSLVAGASAPVIQATGAAGTISVRHHSGGIEFESLSASHNVTYEGIGQVIFNADCNVNANVTVRGIGTITDNTAGMASLDESAFVNMTKINAEADTALSDYDGPTRAELTSDINSVLAKLLAYVRLMVRSDGFVDIDDATELTAINADGGSGAGDYDPESESQEGIRDRGDSAWPTATGFSTHDAAAVWAVAARVLTASTNFNDISNANVLTQVNAALDAAISELTQGAPTATPSLRTAAMLPYMALRDKSTVTATERAIHDDAGTKIAKSTLSDDGTTFTDDEMVSGA